MAVLDVVTLSKLVNVVNTRAYLRTGLVVLLVSLISLPLFELSRNLPAESLVVHGRVEPNSRLLVVPATPALYRIRVLVHGATPLVFLSLKLLEELVLLKTLLLSRLSTPTLLPGLLRSRLLRSRLLRSRLLRSRLLRSRLLRTTSH